MRIIKCVNAGQQSQYEKLVQVAPKIAGEMLNLESSRYEFLDGELVANPTRGYPRITVENRTYTHAASEGYIFYSASVDVEELERLLMAKVQDLEKNMRIPDGGQNLKTYHTIESGYHTNVKVQSQLSAVAGSGSKRGNVKRQFRRWEQRDTTNTKLARFTWWLVPISQFVYEITNQDIAEALSRYVYSVFYDADDICKLGHNETTTNFSRKLLRGFDALVNETVTLTKHGNPVAFELSNYWREYAAGAVMRNIPREKVYKGALNKIQLKPVKLTGENETSTDVCSKCRSILYGSNYVLYGSNDNPDNTMGVAICPLCLHTDTSDPHIENKYFKVLVVQFPNTVENMIKSLSANDERKQILMAATKGVHTVAVEGSPTIVEIGTDYIGITDVDTYLYSDLCHSAKFAGKKVCRVNNTHLLL